MGRVDRVSGTGQTEALPGRATEYAAGNDGDSHGVPADRHCLRVLSTVTLTSWCLVWLIFRDSPHPG